MNRAVALLTTILLSLGGQAHAQGFQLQQYEPVAAGERHLAVEAPWYAPTQSFAAALTLNYGHEPLQGGQIVNGTFKGQSIVDHQVAAHFDVAYSPWERLRLSVSLPLVLKETGQARAGVSPASGAVVGDPRLGAALRLWGDAEKDAFSAHLSGALWIPVGVEDKHAGDRSVRGRVTAVFAGYALKHLSWATNAGVLLRQQAGLNANSTGPGTVGNELQANLALAYANDARSLHVGPELLFGTVLSDGRAFKEQGSHLEALLSGTYRAAFGLQAGAAVGVGLVRSPGTPDVRGLLRIGYAPTRKSKPESEGASGVSAREEQEAPAAEIIESEPPTEVAAAEESAEAEPTLEAAEAVSESTTSEPQPEAPQSVVAVAPAVAQVEAPAQATRAPSLHALPNIRFRKNQSALTDEAGLARSAEILLAHPEVRKVRLRGHSDETGPAEFNQRLSQERAQAVARFLVEQGIPASKLETRGVGSSEPLVTSEDPAVSAKNRRVEIRVTVESQ